MHARLNNGDQVGDEGREMLFSTGKAQAGKAGHLGMAAVVTGCDALPRGRTDRLGI